PARDQRARASRSRLIELLEQDEAALDRRNYSPGHVTASGIVLRPDRTHVLLVFHRRLSRWLQPGGHIEEDDADAAAAAAREVLEETGVVLERDAAPALVGIDVHEIPGSDREPAHLHFDVVWRFVAASGRLGEGSHRERTLWCAIERLSHHGADAPLLRSVERAVKA
ncbi:MAG TPA: NUDIX domain-containing protein, partial [Gemmatimonadales bacterium]|nr:NUDIX domain-containing protein [Gemmatimonadales bacterium]